MKYDVSPEFAESHQACLDHANDLIISAKAVITEGKPNIAYHLATLALEEIGKAGLMFISQQADRSGREAPWAGRHTQDHAKKLFWAFFGAAFGRDVIAQEEIETNKGLAERIHKTRVKGLYVDFLEELSVPSEAISSDECETLINLAEARLNMESSTTLRDLGDDDQKSLSWFMRSTDDPEMRKQILGKKSMEKLAELGSVQKWVEWLKEVYEKNAEENKKLAGQELKREKPDGDEALEDKWKLKIRLYSASHSIRQKPLNHWSDNSNWITLSAVNGAKHKNELLVEFVLPKAVSAGQLWWHGWGLSRHFVTALNIGAFGYFWWYLPKLTDKFYEKLTDLENNVEMKISRSPVLELDWGKRALSSTDLSNAALCFASIPPSNDEKQIEPFNYYVGGLTFLGINDINWQCENNAFGNFWHSFLAAARNYGCWDGKSNVLEYMKNHFSDSSIEIESLEECCKLGRKLENSELQPNEITLKDVGMIKILCDAHFLDYFRKARPGTGGDASERA